MSIFFHDYSSLLLAQRLPIEHLTAFTVGWILPEEALLYSEVYSQRTHSRIQLVDLPFS